MGYYDDAVATMTEKFTMVLKSFQEAEAKYKSEDYKGAAELFRAVASPLNSETEYNWRDAVYRSR